MTERGLEVAYRRGQVLAAYLTLAHPTGQKVSRTDATVDGLLVVDFGLQPSRGPVDMGAKRVLYQSHMTSGSSHRAGLSASSLTDERGGHIARD